MRIEETTFPWWLPMLPDAVPVLPRSMVEPPTDRAVPLPFGARRCLAAAEAGAPSSTPLPPADPPPDSEELAASSTTSWPTPGPSSKLLLSS